MFRKKTIFKNHDEDEGVDLQLTSFVDVFVILLVFLIKTITGGYAGVTPAQASMLPRVQTDLKGDLHESLVLEVTKNAVLLDQRPIAVLKEFAFENEKTFTKALIDGFLQERLRSKKRFPASKVEEFGSHLNFSAHEDTPYQTLRAVMNAAAASGYVDLRLLVLKEK